jgi:hypothetical protein
MGDETAWPYFYAVPSVIYDPDRDDPGPKTLPPGPLSLPGSA